MFNRFKWSAPLILLAASGLAPAQTPIDISGEWAISSSINLAQIGRGPADCEYSGTASLQQNDGVLAGFAELFLDSGVVDCPAEMSAELAGQGGQDGPDFFFSGQLLGGNLGEADFNGQINPDQGGSGQTNVTQGPFSGATGIWDVQRAGFAPMAVPNLTPLGLSILLLLLLVVGYRALRAPGRA